ncbi:MAG: T9SS type A sorting domain-containing protein [Bacteroidetes bacterium]|nr:T9SS type A sorting domain-containing protein [Bacteroidota bacterium]
MEIRLTASPGRHVRIRLYDPTGNCVAPQVDRDVSSGMEVVCISVAALPMGMYIYRIDDGVTETNGKFLVVR